MSQGVDSRPVTTRRRPRRAIPLAVPAGVRLRASASDFWNLCLSNPDLRLERSARGVIDIMSPTNGNTGIRNAILTARLVGWALADASGTAFDSSAGFTLPNGAILSPDASWVPSRRWDGLTADQKELGFAPLCPDFAAEIRSPSDRLNKLRKKMAEYAAQGVRLGWLIDPKSGAVEVYRPGRPAEVLKRPATLAGADVLPGFVLDLKGILFD